MNYIYCIDCSRIELFVFKFNLKRRLEMLKMASSVFAFFQFHFKKGIGVILLAIALIAVSANPASAHTSIMGWYSLGGTLTSEPVVQQYNDGRLVVFVRGTDNGLWYKWQTTPNGGWSAWHSLGGTLTTAPVVAKHPDGRLEIFVRGTDGAVWHKWQHSQYGVWSDWHSFGSLVVTGELAVANNADGRVEVFGSGADGHLWHRWITSNGGWSNWQSLGGSVWGTPVVGKNADGRLEVFMVRRYSDTIWRIYQTAPNGGWSVWNSLGGSMYGNKIAVAQNADGRLELFIRGYYNNRHTVYHIRQVAPNGLWGSWQPLPSSAEITGDPAVIQHADGRLEVFVQGTFNTVNWEWRLHHIYQTTPNGGWSSWYDLGGKFVGGPAVAKQANGRIIVFTRGWDKALWYTQFYN
jgi:hypothetical protein